ncbi:MAG: HEAT repeat domain-containing protein [Polyangiaceae bacterium]
MSIPVLIDCFNEVRRLAIAGSHLAVDDFRLKRLVDPLKATGKKAPVFAKVAEAVEALIGGSEKESAQNLLKLSTLLNAIVVTQAETGRDGSLEDLESEDVGFGTQRTSARTLKPIVDALTTTGSGRLEIVQDAHQRGALKDIRLTELILRGTNDVYPELADFLAETVLPSFGKKAVVPLLRDDIDLNGSAGDARRLKILCRLAPERGYPIARTALDEKASAKMRVAAVEALAHSIEDIPLLLAQAKSRSQDVRRAALAALGHHEHADATELLVSTLDGKDAAAACASIAATPSKALYAAFLKKLETAANELEDGGPIAAVTVLLAGLWGRKDAAAKKLLLRLFEERGKYEKRKDGGKAPVTGKDLKEAVVHALARLEDEAATDTLVSALSNLGANETQAALGSAILTKSPSQVYDAFAPLLKSLKGKTKGKATTQAEAVAGLLISSRRGYYGYYDYVPSRRVSEELEQALLDERWLDRALEVDHTRLVCALVRPGHAKAQKYLFERLPKQKSNERGELVHALVLSEHPKAAEVVAQEIETNLKARYAYDQYRIGRLLQMLPADTAKQLVEAAIAKFPDKKTDWLEDSLTRDASS